MKIVLQTLLYSFLFFSPGFAQKIHYKLKGGTNFSNVAINGRRPFKTNIGSTGGMTIHIPVFKNTLLQTGLIYSKKGDSYTRNFSILNLYPPQLVTVSRKISNNFHYLTLPLLAGYDLNKKLHFYIGPQMAYLLSGREKIKGVQSTSPSYYHKFDFGAVACAEYAIFKEFGVYCGYDYGLSRVMEGVVADNNGTVTGYENYGSHRTFFIGLFYEGKVLSR